MSPLLEKLITLKKKNQKKPSPRQTLRLRHTTASPLLSYFFFSKKKKKKNEKREEMLKEEEEREAQWCDR